MICRPASAELSPYRLASRRAFERASSKLAVRATEIAHDVGDVDIEMVTLALEGLALLTEGAIAVGMQRLDEASAAASSGEMNDANAIGLVLRRIPMSACTERARGLEVLARAACPNRHRG